MSLSAPPNFEMGSIANPNGGLIILSGGDETDQHTTTVWQVFKDTKKYTRIKLLHDSNFSTK